MTGHKENAMKKVEDLRYYGKSIFRDVLRGHPEIPVLLLKAGHDDAINAVFESTLVVLNEHPHTRIVEVEDAGHFLNMECPDKFNKILNLFLVEQSVEANERWSLK